MTFSQAVEQAKRSAKKSDEERFVVRESGEYHVASGMDLDTFFMGIADQDILYSTADGGS